MKNIKCFQSHNVRGDFANNKHWSLEKNVSLTENLQAIKNNETL